MANFKFDPSQSIIICHAEIAGRRKTEFVLKMALDTGATYTMIPAESAVAIGCDPARSKQRIEITTGSSTEYVPIITLRRFRAFGVEIKNMLVVCHDLPSQSPVEGLIGLNFLKQARLIIDFSTNKISVPSPNKDSVDLAIAKIRDCQSSKPLKEFLNKFNNKP